MNLNKAGTRRSAKLVLGREHVTFVDRVLARLGIRGEDRLDIRQDVLLQAHRALAEFRGEASLETWLYRITAREAVRRQRSRQARSSGTVLQVSSLLEPTPLECILQRETELAVLRVLDRMIESKRRALELHIVEGLTMREVAARLGCPLQTAYSRVHAARSEAALMMKED